MHDSRQRLEDQENAVISAERAIEAAERRASDAERRYLAAQAAIQVYPMLDTVVVCAHGSCVHVLWAMEWT